MKTIFNLLAIIMMLIATNATAQTCTALQTQLTSRGQFLPNPLSDGCVNNLYEQNIAFRFKKDTVAFGFTIPMDSVIITGINNLPAGISFTGCDIAGCHYIDPVNSDSTGCLTISGTPTVAYNDSIEIQVEYWIGVPFVGVISIIDTVKLPLNILNNCAVICTISNASLSNVGVCNNNGTQGNAADDFYTTDLTVNFTNPPAAGTLRIEPGNVNVLDVVEIPVGSLVGNSHIFTGVRLRTGASTFAVDVEFSAEIACSGTVVAPAISNCSNQTCAALQAQLTNRGQFLPNPLPDGCVNNLYEQNIVFRFKKDTVVFGFTIPMDSVIIAGINNLPAGISFTGCDIAGCHYINPVNSDSTGCLTISGTPTVAYNDSIEIHVEYFVGIPFVGVTVLTDTVKLPLHILNCNASACDIIGISFNNVSTCNNNGNTNLADDFFTADLIVNFVNPPTTGNLQIVSGGDAIGTNTVSVGSLVGNSHTFTTVNFKADGTPTVVAVEFTVPANQCVQVATGPMVQHCTAICDITSAVFQNIGSCNNNGTVNNSADDFYTANLNVNFTNPPSTGTLRIKPGNANVLDVIEIPVASLAGSSHTFTGVRLRTSGAVFTVEVEFSADNVCVQPVIAPAITSCSATTCASLQALLTTPHQFLPNPLPDGCIDSIYNQNIAFRLKTDTVITIPVFGTITIPIDSVIIIGINSLPAGINFISCDASNCTYLPGTINTGCLTIGGTPTNSYNDSIEIVVDYWIGVLGAPQALTEIVKLPLHLLNCNASACDITSAAFQNIGSCNNNGTVNNSADDFYTANLNVNFTNSPSTGTLRIKPGNPNVLDVVEIPVASLAGSSHTFTGVRLRTTGAVFTVEVEFSADNTCVQPVIAPSVTSCSVTPCATLQAQLTTPHQFLPNPLPDGCVNSIYNQNIAFRLKTDTVVTVPVFGTLVIPIDSVIISGINSLPAGINFTSCDALNCTYLPGTINTGCLTIGGTPLSSYNDSIEIVVDYWIGILGAPQALSEIVKLPLHLLNCNPSGCDITGVTLQNIGSCNDNGTINTNDDFFTADVVVNFVNAPATGNLQIVPGGDAIGTNAIAVGSLVGGTHTFTGVHFKADGTATVVEVEFTIPVNLCTQTISGPTVQPCSDPCAGTGGSPVFVLPTPLCGSTITTSPGVPVTFSLSASDVGHPNNPITLTTSGSSAALSSAILSPPLPLTGNPVNANFSWTPTFADIGQQTAGFKIHDPCTNGNEYCFYTIDVVSPCGGSGSPVFVPPSPPCGSTISATVGTPLSFSLTASDVNNPGNPITLDITGSGIPAGAILNPLLPSTGNPVNTTFDWTPTLADIGQHAADFVIHDPCTNGNEYCFYTINVLPGIPLCNIITTDDNNPCTLDACDPTTGVVTHTPIIIPAPTITGPSIICTNTQGTYSAIGAIGATNYVWTIPAGVNFVSGQGTSTIVVQFTTACQSGNICVTASNSCGSTNTVCLPIIAISKIPVLGVITGQSNAVCVGASVQYCVAAVSNAASYLWTVPANTQIASGQGTPCITLNILSGFVSGIVSVRAQNCKGLSGPKSLTIRNLPLIPGAINGAATNLCLKTGVPFSIANVTNATSYLWTVPTGCTIASGQGTNSITVDFAANFTTGNITVRGVNACGNGSVRTLAIKAKPTTPSPINGLTPVCKNALGIAYNVTSIPGLIYTWTVPAGSIVASGQSTANINVNFGITSGNVKVIPSNACGNGSARTKSVTVNNCIRGEYIENQIALSVYPNPVSAELNIEFNADTESSCSIILTDMVGKIIYSESMFTIAGINKKAIDVNEYADGMYFLSVKSNYSNQSVKIIIQ